MRVLTSRRACPAGNVRVQPLNRRAPQQPKLRVHAAPESAPESAPQNEGDDKSDQPEGEAWEGLAAEDDWEVEGSNLGSLSQNTELGRAVDSACTELDTLSSLENSVLKDAQAILEKMGYKNSLFNAPTPSVEEEEAGTPDQKPETGTPTKE